MEIELLGAAQDVVMDFIRHYEVYGIALIVGGVIGWVCRSAAIYRFKRIRGNE